MPKLSIYFLFLIYLTACSDRLSDPQSDEPVNTNTNAEISKYLKIISPLKFGDTVHTSQGKFVEGLFVNYDGNLVWAVYSVQNGKQERVSLQIDFNENLPFTMYTHKYIDDVNHYPTAISAALPVDDSGPLETILLAVAASEDTVMRNKEFRTVQPTLFGEVVETEQGPFVEAIFDDLIPESVWSIQQTISNGNTFKVDFTRRVDLPLAYYLVPGTRIDNNGQIIQGIRIGLPHQPLTPLRNIEVCIKR